MSRVTTALLLGVLLLAPGGGQALAEKSVTLQLEEDLRLLHVARTLDLSQDQVQKMVPLLQAVQERLKEQTTSDDAVWKEAQASITAVNQAWEKAQKADRTAKDEADKAAKAHQQALQATDKDIAAKAQQILGLLDKGKQLPLIETEQQQAARLENLARYEGSPSLAHYMARPIMALRRMRRNEYRVLRIAIALRLAQLVAPPNGPQFAGLVNGLLRIEDTVRRMSDADYAKYSPDLPSAIVTALRLPSEALGTQAQVTRDDFLFFVRSPRTVELLQTYKPTPPKGGEGQ